MNRFLLASSFWLLAVVTAYGHVDGHPSVHDTVAGILDRFGRTMDREELSALTVAQAESLLTPDEKLTLSREHVSFRVNVPVVVTVLHDVKQTNEPFWLREPEFRRTEARVKTAAGEFGAWEKAFPAGLVGLGVNSLAGGGNHYFVAVRSADATQALHVIDLYPGSCRLGDLRAGLPSYADDDDLIETVPGSLAGATLIQTLRSAREAARLLRVLYFTPYPATARPDHVILTWSGDPRRTQTIQWRTATRVRQGYVLFQKKAERLSFRPRSPKRVKADTARMATPRLVNDPLMHWHTVTLQGLEPDTAYVYSVGDGSKDGWTEMAEFTTAPDGIKPFSFVYMGDAQNGLDRWGTLVQNAFRRRPDAAFYLMAGDLVNRGAERDDWDSLFHHARGVFDRRQLVPAIGNHECQGGHPSLYLKFFDLPRNGPEQVEAERAYAFEYSNALFVILDSNLKPETQTAWLDQQLGQSKATWKFVAYHHPAYSSAPNRDNKSVRELWGPLFDKHHVDLALQGHDHAYLRTHPMKGGQRAASPKEGTVYVVSVSGTKFYKQDPRDYTEFGMTNVATYQVLDIQVSGDRLVYRAYDIDGNRRDELVIEK